METQAKTNRTSGKLLDPESGVLVVPVAGGVKMGSEAVGGTEAVGLGVTVGPGVTTGVGVGVGVTTGVGVGAKVGEGVGSKQRAPLRTNVLVQLGLFGPSQAKTFTTAVWAT
jgi:hypothetical protein